MEAAPKEVPQASIVEFEELFVEDCQSDDPPTSSKDQTDIIEVSVIEAAKLLGITDRTVWRRISNKKLDSIMVDGKTIIRLRQTDIPARQSDMQACQSDSVTDIERLEVHPVCDSTDNVTDRQPKVVETESAIELIAELAAKLEAATYRNGYLEALLKNNSEKILLLPDLEAQVKKKELLELEVAELRNQANKAAELETALNEKDSEIVQLKESLLLSQNKGWLGSVASWFKGKS